MKYSIFNFIHDSYLVSILSSIVLHTHTHGISYLYRLMFNDGFQTTQMFIRHCLLEMMLDSGYLLSIEVLNSMFGSVVSAHCVLYVYQIQFPLSFFSQIIYHFYIFIPLRFASCFF